MKSIQKFFNIKNKVAIITGGGGFLAGPFAEILAEAGAKIVVVDINKDKITKRAERISDKFGVKSLALETDITDEKAVKKMVQTVVKKLGSIDILINNAALNPVVDLMSGEQFTAFEKYPLNLWKKEMEVNLTGAFICLKEVGKQMMKQKKGVVINISSIYGMAAPDQRIYKKGKFKPASYCVTKGAILNLTKYLSSYWGKNIRVNCLSLGGVYSNQDKDFIKKYSAKTMLGRMADKDEIKAPLLFLASDASSYMTGANLVIDGGWTAW